MEFITSSEFGYIILPLLIFLSRIVDVSLGTLRIIFVSKGLKAIAPVIGFVEVLIWIIAVTRIMENLDNWFNYIAYAAGFAMGNYVGMLLEERLAIGHELIRVITKKEAVDLIEAIRSEGYGMTSVEAMGKDGEVAVLFLITKRKKTEHILNIIKKYNPNATYTIENVRSVSQFTFPTAMEGRKRLFKGM